MERKKKEQRKKRSEGKERCLRKREEEVKGRKREAEIEFQSTTDSMTSSPQLAKKVQSNDAKDDR